MSAAGENGSIVSGLSLDNTNRSELSIWSQAKMILTGKNPSIPEEPCEDEAIIGLSVLTGSSGEIEGIVAPVNSFEHEEQYHDAVADDEKISPPKGVRWKSELSVTNIIADKSTTNNDSVDFLKDKLSDMTWSRRIALFLMKRYAWYNPSLKKPKIPENEVENPGDTLPQNLLNGTHSPTSESLRDLRQEQRTDLLMNDAYPFTHSRRENPSLERAWAYFEHVAMPRYIIEPKPVGYKKKNIFIRIIRKYLKANKQLQRAEPGEKELETALYQPIYTPHKQLGDFGLGIGLYFSTLRALAVITLFAGILNTANFIYFSSDEYNKQSNLQILNPLVRGSAICTDISWVPCLDCNGTNPDNFGRNRVATGYNSETGTTQTFFLRNNCQGATIEQGMVSYATLLFVMIGTIALNVYLKRMEIAFDEDEQTAQDYSVVVENPPPDATNPQEWHDFFKNAFGAHLTACTVSVDNDLLVRTLVTRREILRKIELAFDPGTSLDTLTIARIAAKQERERRFMARLIAKVVPGIPEWFAQLVVTTSKVQGLAQQDYPATNVFLTFETEKAQRDVLEAYSLGKLAVNRNKTSALKDPDKHLFRGNLVLKVSEPDEPNTVRWQDLNEKFKERIKQQVLTGLCTLVAVFLIALIVQLVKDNDSFGDQGTAYTIAAFNTIFPMFAKFLTSFEAHSSESDIQRSLFAKIALFRWVNTAVVITLITPFTYIIQNKSLIDQIQALFFAEIVTTNVIQFADPVGHLQRHILAPRAKTQDAMDLNMQGQTVELAERYTSTSKIIFLAFWYCSIYPGALLLCSLSLFITYFMDRFSLMRTWKRPPQIGSGISQFSRRYVMTLSLVVMAVISSYFWACFPFDNLCETEEPVSDEYLGTWKIYGNTTILVEETDPIYKFCFQDFLRMPGVRFPFIPKMQMEGQEWMTPDQEIVSNIYGWSAVGVIFLVFLSYVWKLYLSFMEYFQGSYEPCGKDMGINFSDCPSMSTYIPQVTSNVFSYPLLACNIDNIDTGLLEWNDPERPHVFYDLTKDAEVLLRGQKFGSNVVFSQVAHWPPVRKEKKKSSRRVAKEPS